MKFSEFILLESKKELKWAIGSNSDKAIKQFGHREDFMIVWLNPDEVIKNTDPEMRVSPDNKENHIGSRMQRALDHFEKDEWMDPPIIAYDRYTNKKYKVIVDDGRHRIAALSKMGEKSFPAYIMKGDLKDLKEILNIK